jgi:ABC-2 type transport system permease protein
MKTYTWLIRREIWENRAIWTLPAGVGLLLVLGALFGQLHLPPIDSAAAPYLLGGIVMLAASATFLLILSIYSFWYLQDCLYTDRKDRSVLFWKSLPVSDAATVIAKLTTGLIVIPLVYLVFADVTTAIIAFTITIRGSMHSISVGHLGAGLWQPQLWWQLQVLWIYLIATLAVWYLPVAGWLLLVSGWVSRAVILWTLLPPLALYLLEKLFLSTHVVGSQIADRLGPGYFWRAFRVADDGQAWLSSNLAPDAATTSHGLLELLNPVGFLSSPATWVGALVGIGLIYGAILVRQRRSDI